MIHKKIYTTIEDGIDTITRNPDIINIIFERQYGLTKGEVSKIREYWAASPPTVKHGFASAEPKFPMYSIVLGDEHETEHFLANDAGFVEDGEYKGADTESVIWDLTYQLMTWAEHPDVTAWYYEILKEIIVAAVPTYNEEGIFTVTLRGNDLQPDPRYIPEHLFVRQLTFNCQREFIRINTDSLFTKFNKVGGLYVNSETDPVDVAEVIPRLTVFEE